MIDMSKLPRAVLLKIVRENAASDRKPAAATHTHTPEARIEVLRERQAAGLSLWNGLDVIQGRLDGVAAGNALHRHPTNGSVIVGRVTRPDEPNLATAEEVWAEFRADQFARRGPLCRD